MYSLQTKLCRWLLREDVVITHPYNIFHNCCNTLTTLASRLSENMVIGSQLSQLSGQKRKVAEAKLDPTLETSKRLDVNTNTNLAEKEKRTPTSTATQNTTTKNEEENPASLLHISSFNGIDRCGHPKDSESGSPSLSLFHMNNTSSAHPPGNGFDKRVTFHEETNMNRKAKPQPMPVLEIAKELALDKSVGNGDSQPNGSGDGGEGDLPIKVAHIKSQIKTNRDIESIIEHADLGYHRIALQCTALWFFLTCLSYYIGYKTDSLVSLTGVERKAPMIAAMLIGTSVFGTALPLFIKGKVKNISGVIVCAILVHCIAFTTDVLLAYFPTPVFLDQVSGTKVYLLRWCEWAPLAFLMTFLTETCSIDDGKTAADQMTTSGLTTMLSAVQSNDDSIDSMGLRRSPTINENERNSAYSGRIKADLKKMTRKALTPAYSLAWCQGLSTFCGWLFPFCPGPISWTITMITSCGLYLMIFHRLHYRKIAFKNMVEGSTIAEQELYHWARLSLGLLKACTLMWTVLVVAYCIYTCGPMVLPESSFVNSIGFGMICESIIDVLFKSVYMLIIMDVHDTIFDKSARSERRLEELRQVSSSLLYACD